ncbi:MAG TPA: hypothetical protein VIW46_03020 [Acidimicrobiia bacterium]
MDAHRIWDELRHLNSLLDLADDPSERQVLLERKQALQLQARALAAEGVPDISLESELAEAERRLVLLEKDRLDHVRHAGGGDFSGDIQAGVDVIYMNKRIDAAQGREELEARVAELRRLIAARRAADSEP